MSYEKSSKRSKRRQAEPLSKNEQSNRIKAFEDMMKGMDKATRPPDEKVKRTNVNNEIRTVGGNALH